jgi:uncharacterized protein (TIGR00255 family)
MLKSMTGFGRAHWEDGQVRIQVEVRSLNAKHADVSLRLPRVYSDKELAWKNLVVEPLERGRISLIVDYEYKQADIRQVEINQTLFKAYYSTLADLAKEVGSVDSDLFSITLKIPGVMGALEEATADEAVIQKIESAIRAAVKECDQTRGEEGEVLARNIAGYLQHISQSLTEIEALDSHRVESIRLKLVDKISSLKSQLPIDENRLEQELIYYIERIDITEEKVRLAKHLAYFENVLYHEAVAGKKLGFIAQEIGREINTIGAKANDATMQKCVILMKDELEKIKEQLQNIL